MHLSVKKISFVILFHLISLFSFCQFDPHWILLETKILENLDSIDFEFSKKDTVDVDQLDILLKTKLWGKDLLTTDTSLLNIYNFPEDSIPHYHDSIYRKRIELLRQSTTIELTYNHIVRSHIDVYSVKKRKHTSKILGLAHFYFPYFEKTLDKYDIPLEMKYLAVIESALNAKAGSHAGAKGLWQFMPGTGKMYGLQVTSLVDDRYDPFLSTEAACKFMCDLYDIYQDWFLVMAAYNSGPGNVNRAIRYAGGLKNYWAIWPYLPRETRGYVPAFIAVNYVMEYASEHNLYPIDPEINYHEVDTVPVTDILSLEQVAELFNTKLDTLRFLNPRYKRDIIPGNDGKKHYLRLPYDIATLFLENPENVYSFKTKKGIEKEALKKQMAAASISERRVHIVKSGETLGGIARRYKIKVDRLKQQNKLKNNNIYPGQKLVIVGGSEKTAPAATTATQKDQNAQYHIVKRGETLGTIALKYHTKVSNIKKWNNLSSDFVRINQKLIIKAEGTKTTDNKPKTETTDHSGNHEWYTVKEGDTIWDIAKKYTSITSDDILKANDLRHNSKLKIGQRIKIPVKG